MTDKPIIFSGPMIRALLDGQKTQTRRVLKPQPEERANGLWHVFNRYGGSAGVHVDQVGEVAADYAPWRSGDRLWVRETCGRRTASFLGIEATNGVEEAFYVADGEDVVNEHEFNLHPWWRGKVCPSIHMPRLASRLTLIVEAVKVERLQEISYEDAILEGVGDFAKALGDSTNEPTGETAEQTARRLQWPQRAFSALWKEIHGPDAWAANPWVAAVSFRTIHTNIDAIPGEQP